MSRAFKAVFAAIILVLSLVAPVAAGPFEDAVAAFRRGDYATAVRLFRPLADKGDDRAQSFLGLMYMAEYSDGRGVKKDYAEAVKWFRLAANQGSSSGQFFLGSMYDNGHGVAQDYVEAMRWYRKAADQGDADAQSNLGFMYSKGQGVPQDFAESVKWHEKAANHGDANHQYRWGEIIRDGRFMRKDSARNCDLEESGRRQESNLNRTAAELNREWRRIESVLNRDGAERNRESEAQIIYERRAQGSDARRKACDAEMAEVQRVRDKDSAEALEWFRKAADRGHVKALSSLGSHYRKKEPVLAHMWFNIAAAQGDKDAATSRDEIAKNMTHTQTAEAQKLAREWMPTVGPPFKVPEKLYLE